MINKIEIGLRIKEFATKNFLSLAELSRKLGMSSPQGLNPYTSGKSLLGGEHLARLAELGCDLNWLLNGTKTNTANEPLEGYGMNYKTILEENKKLHDDLDRLKIKVFDLQEENEKLRLQLNDFEQVNSELLEELSELKKGLTPTN